MVVSRLKFSCLCALYPFRRAARQQGTRKRNQTQFLQQLRFRLSPWPVLVADPGGERVTKHPTSRKVEHAMFTNASDWENAVKTRAAKDAGYRRRLLAAPRAAIAEATGRELPADVRIHILEEAPRTVHLVLPAHPAQESTL